MGFSVRQLRALRRDVQSRHIRKRESNGRELSYIEGAHECVTKHVQKFIGKVPVTAL